MSGVNQFQTFAEGGSANALTPSAYAALTTLIANGYQTGVANSQQINTTLRQAAYASAVLAGIISDAGYDALDNGDLATFKANLLKAVANPVGTPLLWPTATAPAGYLLCNGAAVSRTAYAALFAVIGTTFGAGDGSTTFNLPDTRNRMPIGAGSLYAVGGTGGSKDAIIVSHTHTASLAGSGSGTANTGGSHTHTYKTYGLGNNGLSGNANTNSDWGYAQTGNPPNTAEGSHSHSVNVSVSTSGSTDATGSSGTNANLPPYLAFSTVIKY